MRFRVRWKLLGGHVHCRFFQAAGETWQKNGDLVFDEAAWLAFVPRAAMAGIEFLPEEEP